MRKQNRKNEVVRPISPPIPPRPMRPTTPVPYYPYVPDTPMAPTPDLEIEPGPPVMKGTEYLQGYLNSIKGRFVRIDFLIGTNTFVDKEGTLVDVGIDHVVLREAETDDLLVCDLYSIKFVKVYY